LARSTEDPVPSNLDIFENAITTDNTKKGTLAKDAALGNLLRGPLTSGLPAKPDGKLTLFFNDNTISDLWIVVTWNE
jgi:hypothetical protein